jgi:hypothetical protein
MMADQDEVSMLPPDSQILTQQPLKRKKGVASKTVVDDCKLNGFDRTPGWHKRKNVPNMVNLSPWVSVLSLSLYVCCVLE